MNFVSAFMAVFAVIGGIDLIFGSRFGLGKEFEKGFMLFGNFALSMIGMIVLAPALGNLISPVSTWIYNTLHIDPSILPATFFANDMGGANLSVALSQSETLGLFNGLVVSSMMGCTISFTIPVALGIVEKKNHEFVLTGFLCGIVTIPIGCFLAGLLCKIGLCSLFFNLLPMIIFSVIIALGLALKPNLCIKIFSILGVLLRILITIGLILGIITHLTGIEIIPGLETLGEGGRICLNASVVMAGAFPFLAILSKLIKKPICAMGNKLCINEASAFGFISSLATSVTTFKSMENMDSKGIVLNSAFAISAAFTFAGHLAFTLSFAPDYIVYVIIGKLTSGILSVVAANFIYKKWQKRLCSL